jgi:hypothetical protein
MLIALFKSVYSILRLHADEFQNVRNGGFTTVNICLPYPEDGASRSLQITLLVILEEHNISMIGWQCLIKHCLLDLSNF